MPPVQTMVFLPSNRTLREYIECFWVLKASPAQGRGAPVLPPKPNFDLVLSFAGPTVWQDRLKRRQPIRASFLSGIRQEPFTLHPRERVDYLSIRFRPGGLHPFLRFPLSDLANRAVDLDMLGEEFTDRLTETIWEKPSASERVRAIEARLLAVLARREKVRSPLLDHCLAWIHGTQGTLRIREICADLGTGYRKLHREFSRCLGVTPKRYARIVRFDAVLDRVARTSRRIDWADLAYRYSFTDQAHLIREFQDFLGQSPRAYTRACNTTADVCR